MKWLDKLTIFVLLLLMAVSNVHGQTPGPATTNTADNEDRTILTRNEFSGGVVIHSSGWGITLRRAKQKTYKRKTYFELDIVSMTDVKGG